MAESVWAQLPQLIEGPRRQAFYRGEENRTRRPLVGRRRDRQRSAPLEIEQPTLGFMHGSVDV